jgi:hypothetical protein
MWAYVHVGPAALAGLTAGYVMFVVNGWLQSVVGLTGFDFGQAGLLYVGGNVPGARGIGILFHLINSVLFGLLYALTAYPLVERLAVGGGPILVGIVGGMVYGVAIWLGAMLIAMPMVGLGIFGRTTCSATPALLALGLHLIFGLFLGLVYLP